MSRAKRGSRIGGPSGPCGVGGNRQERVPDEKHGTFSLTARGIVGWGHPTPQQRIRSPRRPATAGFFAMMEKAPRSLRGACRRQDPWQSPSTSKFLLNALATILGH